MLVYDGGRNWLNKSRDDRGPKMNMMWLLELDQCGAEQGP